MRFMGFLVGFHATVHLEYVKPERTRDMKFSQWIEESGLTRAEVARRLGASRGNVGDLCNFRYWPSRTMMVRIIELTDGAVTPNDFLPAAFARASALK